MSPRATGVELDSRIRTVPHFPKPGIQFRDMTPLLGDADAFAAAVDALAGYAVSLDVDVVVAAEARGFILGGAIARTIGAAFVPARKPGRLPAPTLSAAYALEYGTDSLELHADAFGDGARVLIHDDLLATGGTAGALCELSERLGATVVGCAFLIELRGLGGRERLAPREVRSLVTYDES